MLKKYLTLMVLSGLILSCKTKNISNDLALSNPITAQLDLVNLENDKVQVTINPGRFVNDTVVYRLPRVVQGTYAVSDFGRYIEGLKGIDYDGNELEPTKQDTNTWLFPNAQNLDKITYWANDTFDQEVQGGIGEEVPFSPSGTNIEPKQVMLNLHGFVGYFDSLKNNAYEIGITAPDTFNYTSPLQEISTSKARMARAKLRFFMPIAILR